VAAIIANIAKGKLAYYAGLPAANDAIVWVVFTGTETDVLATSLNEATFTGYARIVHTSQTVAVDDTNNWTTVDDGTDPSWSPTSAEAVTRIGAFYDPDTTTGTDADLIPLFIDDFAFTTPTTGTIAYQVASGGYYKAA
jgi:hypothetical protein